MLFNSIDFGIFLPLVFILYWFVTNRSLLLQNSLIVLSSFVFYGWWDWRFLSLLVISALTDYIVGILLGKTEKQGQRKMLLGLSILVNIGLLLTFKYFNFFVQSFVSGFSLLGYTFPPYTLHLVLPVGISFYTFQTLSYAIDVYRKRTEPTNNLIAFFAFVSFFPQLVAGPIERAAHLLPQFTQPRIFNRTHAVSGLRQILWGLFKKIVIADTCAGYVNHLFNHSDQYTGSTLALGAFLFAIQIYGDFSGYSDIAIGTGRLFGINLMRNFAFPYFSRDIAEFWRRWHISLTTWFRDYIYIPLGGSKGNNFTTIRNTFIVFLLSGLWHGANLTFIVWGVFHALCFLPLLLFGANRKNLNTVASGKVFPSVKEVLQILFTFTLTTLGWIFFRAESLTSALAYIGNLFTPDLFSVPVLLPLKLLFFIGLLLVIEWAGREKEFALEGLFTSWYRPLRWAVYLILSLTILIHFGKDQQFIYFQF